MSQSVRAWLAAETRDVHEALHSHPRLQRLMAPDLSQQELAGLLEDYRAVYGGAVAALHRQHLWPELDLSPAVDALDRDLAALGAPPHAQNRRLFDAPLQGAEAALGGLYVLTGAQFGGKIIGRHLVASPLTFQSAFFSETRALANVWAGVLAALETHGVAPQKAQAIRAAALDMFETFGVFMHHHSAPDARRAIA